MNPNIPAGWLQHPASPVHMYNPATQQVAEIPAAAPVPAIPAIPAVPAIPAAAPAAQAGADANFAQQLLNRTKKGGSNFGSDFIWLDFEKLQRGGDQSTMRLRFVEGAKREDGTTPPPVISVAQHRITPTYMPPDQQKEKRQIYFETCLSSAGGPGNCPLCALWSEIAKTHAKGPEREQWYWLRAQERYYWQGFNLDDPMKHFVQVKDDAGQPVADAYGRPQTKMVPGVFIASKKLTNQIAHIMALKQKGARPLIMTSWEYGFALALVKSKTGDQQIDVEYAAIPDEEGTVPAAFDAARPHLLNLEERFQRFPKVETIQAIADYVRSMVQQRGAQQQWQQPQQQWQQPQQQWQAQAPHVQPPQPQAPQYVPPPVYSAPQLPAGYTPPAIPAGYTPPLPAPPMAVPQAAPPVPQAPPAAPPMGARPGPGMPQAQPKSVASDPQFERDLDQIPF